MKHNEYNLWIRDAHNIDGDIHYCSYCHGTGKEFETVKHNGTCPVRMVQELCEKLEIAENACEEYEQRSKSNGKL